MRAGGGAPKGSSFEREIAVTLSLWLSHGARRDLMCRTGGSGGQYTNAAKRGTPQFQPGDLMAVDSLAYDFCKAFVIECKTWKDLELIRFIRGEGLLFEAMQKVQREAKERQSSWMLIAKQNHRKPLLFVPTDISYTDLTTKQFLPYALIQKWHENFQQHMWHTLFREQVYLFSLEEFLQGIQPEDLFG